MRNGVAGTLLRAIGLLALYLATAGLLHEVGAFRYAVLWLPTGVAVVGLWLLGLRYAPVIALGTILHRLAIGYGFAHTLPAALGNALEAVVAVALLRRLGFSADFGRLRDGLALLAAALIAPAVSATIGRTSSFMVADVNHYLSGLPAWWRMNALGVLVVAPLALSWITGRWTRPRPRTVLEILILAAASALVIWTLISFDPAREDAGMVLSYLAIPVALYAAVRFGVRGASLATAATVVLLTLGTIHGVGPFVEPLSSGAAAPVRQVVMQAVFAIVAITSMLFGAAISERHSALAATREERERREELVASINRNVNEGLFRVGRGGLLFVNTALARMLGYPDAESLAGLPAESFAVDPDRARTLRQRVLAGEPLNSAEIRLRRRDGAVLTTMVSCTAVRGTDGTIQFVDGAVADVTMHKELESRLRESQKLEALGKLAGGIAHDFNNLLTAMTGYAEALRTEVPAGSRAADDAREISSAVDRASSLTRQLLAYSRRQVMDPRTVDLRVVVERMVALLRRLIGEHIQLNVQLSQDPLWVRIDPGQLEQVILNLMLNARDAMPGGGVLVLGTLRVDLPVDGRRVREHPAGTHACLRVRDTGSGMTEEVLSRAFDPFFTTKEPGRGTGLGLSTVHGIVHQSDGAILLESAPDAGTTAFVCLPLVAGVPAGPPDVDAGMHADTLRQTGRILVVEDDDLVRLLIMRTLHDAGHTVETAADGAAGLHAAVSAVPAFDLVITDAVMPRLGGVELARTLLERRPGARVLLISGYTQEPIEPAGALPGRFHYLQKPFAPAVLLDRVAALLNATERAAEAGPARAGEDLTLAT